jgi:hypothetical protein
MNWQKVDASLAGALGDVEDPDAPDLDVFVHLASNPGPTESAYLQQLGIVNIASGRQVFTAKLSARAIEQLSDRPSVQSMRLTRRLNVLENL